MKTIDIKADIKHITLVAFLASSLNLSATAVETPSTIEKAESMAKEERHA